MVAAYSRWVRQRDATASETAFQNLTGKVACKLLELQAVTQTPHGSPIPIDLPQARLAAMLGASREHVNRALGGLVASGEVRRLGRQLLATNLELEPSRDDGELEFRLARANELLLQGRIRAGNREVALTH